MKFVITNFCIFWLLIFSVHSLSVGSDSAVSRQGQINFPEADSDNKMLGFASFEAGFVLEDSNTTCTFDSFFPVSGTVNMNGGSLYLAQDLVFDEGVTLACMGSVWGDGNCVDCSISVTALVYGSSVAFDNVIFNFSNDVSWDISALLQGNCVIDCAGKSISLTDNGSMTVASGACVTFKNAILKGLKTSNFSCQDNTASIIFQNAEICLSHDVNFSNGSILFDQDVSLTGTNQFTYSSVMASTIASQAKLTFDKNVMFYYAPAIADGGLFYMTDKTSSLYLDGCTLKSTETRLQLSHGRLFLDNLVTFSGVISGDGTVDGELYITICSGAWLNVYGDWDHDDGA